MSLKLSNHEIELGCVKVYVSIALLDKPLRVDTLPSINDSYAVVGLPSLEHAEPCKLALSYLYALEERVIGSRVKKTPILILMNLLGVKQVRDVVERVGEARAVVALGLDPGVSSVLIEVLKTVGYSVLSSESSSFTKTVC
ncbi:MAG: hypothetical protein QXK97_01410, partial [Acidilobaceae archaeon]